MIVDIKKLVKKYGNKVVINNLNLSIAEGEIYGLLGSNGAGKTTLINSIIGITAIESGEINIFGKQMNKAKSEIKKHIGVVPQNIALFTEFSAYENVKFFGKLYGLKGKELTDGVKEALDFVELWDRKNDLPGKYSGGMQRRLNIACAIVHKPQLIIMDEPTVGIDPHSRNHIMESIKRLNKLGSTIIYTSHYMEEVEALCDKVAIINYGKIVIEGTKDEIKHYVKEDKTLEVVLDKIEPQSIDQINKINSVKSCSYEENRLVIVISKTCDDISEIIKVLSRCNIKINHINMKEKHLEDIFLSVTEKNIKE
ncbi:ABC transporter ATP-binding protein [Streptococcus mutans]|uniref:ABC transporter ATP-binding protein n=1 Tax=Streptococcus mutans TaxID=1309 RepID=UPI0002B593FB|nr:ABC transporter ATP-binding protein [Streptococcus mutans]EMB60438.1 ABC-type multidrug transport system, ATP-ase compoment [Streptococcus mutans 1SM1]EMB63321.1 ABC-type multidrug transport system, ATP-ase compoment [Streptococcus mutans 4SM1]EMB72759.1 ABC-type multidrug transport system, ATP-ase compoment [Streptococcus mutans 4VF1]EMB75030.1 ABC-type multidrug transport system, ATP-ase compoment [Streptococcus mutans 15VF2]EMC31227.1 ABC-type multidrug transport system, ATP-ase compomen